MGRNHREPACSHDTDCNTCGAPRMQGLTACSYCQTAYPGIQGGTRCPRCGNINLPNNPNCASCRTPLVRACIFCGSASPLHAVQCVRCREAFAGAEQRKQQREEQVRQQQMMNMASQGIGMLGSVAGTVVNAMSAHQQHAHTQQGGFLHMLGHFFEEASHGHGQGHGHGHKKGHGRRGYKKGMY